MGILDMFDSPDILNLILGGTPPGAPPTASPQPGNPTGAPMMNPPTPQQNYNMAQAGWPTQTPNNVDQGAFNPPAAPGGGMMTANAAPGPQPPPVPPGPPSPAASMAAAAQLPTNMRPPTAPQPSGAPPMPPPNPSPPGSTYGNLTAAFGLPLRPAAPLPQVNPWQTATAALGRGLATVGGNTAGGAFARGMGGAIIGGQASNNQQEQQVRQAKNDLFNQSSTAFRDMMLAKRQEDMESYRQAQGNYLNARANMARLGGTGSNAWQTATPYGRMIQVENEVQKYEKGQQVILQKQWGLNGTTPDQQQKDLDALQQKSDAYRQRLYKAAGINSAQANQMKDMGTSADKPFNTKGMTLDQFNTDVPMGAWYTDQNGVARQRTVPPGGMQNMGQPQQPTQAAQPQSDTGTYTADMAANTPAPTEAYGQQ